MWKWNKGTDKVRSKTFMKGEGSDEPRYERHSTRRLNDGSTTYLKANSKSKDKTFSALYDTSKRRSTHNQTSDPRSNSTSTDMSNNTTRTISYAKLFAIVLIALAIVAIPFMVNDSNDAAVPNDGRVGSVFEADQMVFEVTEIGTANPIDESGYGKVKITGVVEFTTVLTISNIATFNFGDGPVTYYVTKATGQSFDTGDELTEFKIDTVNPSTFFTVDSEGVLFTHDMKTLVRYPIDKKDITEYTVPANTQTIGDSAFYHCMYIENVHIPNSVTLIDVYAFSGSGVVDVDIQSLEVTVGGSAFNRCTNLTTITLPANATLQASVFNGSTSLKTVKIVGSPTAEHKIAFESSLKDWALPGLRTTSGVEKEIVIDVSEYLILPKMFLGDATTSVEENMISFTEDATDIDLNENVFYKLGGGTFGASELKGKSFVIFEKNLEETEKYDLSVKVRDVDGNPLNGTILLNGIPSNKISIYMYFTVEFSAENDLIYLDGTENEYVFIRWEMWEGGTEPSDAEFQNPYRFDFKKDAEYVAVFAKIADQDEGEISFTYGALGYSITGAETVQVVDCDPDATAVTIYGTVKSPWKDGDGIERLFKITTVSPDAFDGASNLTKIDVDGSSIFASNDGVLFKKNGGIEFYELVRYPLGKTGSYDMPDETRIVGNSSFYYSQVTSVEMSKTLVTIRSYAFEGTNLATVVLPDTVVTIGRDSFKDCPYLTELTIYSSVQTINLGAFSGSTDLRTVTLKAFDNGNQDPAVLTDVMRDSLFKWAFNGMPDWQIETLIVDSGNIPLTLPEFDVAKGMVNSVVILGTSINVSPGPNMFYENLTDNAQISDVDDMKGKVFTYFEESDSPTADHRWVASYQRPVTLNIQAWEQDGEDLVTKPGIGKVKINDGADGESATASVYSPAKVTVTALQTNQGYVFMYWMFDGEIVEVDGVAVRDKEYRFTLEQDINGGTFEIMAIFGLVYGSDEGGYLNSGFEFTDGNFVYGLTSTGNAAILDASSAAEGSDGQKGLATLTVLNNANFHVGNVDVPFEVTSIHAYAFDGLKDLEKILVQEGNKYYNASKNGALYRIVGDNPYHELFRLPEGAPFVDDFVINDNTVVIGDSAFYACNNLTTVKIPSSVTNIALFAFENAIGLTHMVIPDTVKTIGDEAFRGCTSLRTLSIPATTELGSSVFLSAPLKDVTITTGIPQTVTDEEDPNVGLQAVTLAYNISTWMISESGEFDTLTLDVHEIMELPFLARMSGKTIIFTEETNKINIDEENPNQFYMTSQSTDELKGEELAGKTFTLINDRWATADVYSITLSADSTGVEIENNQGAPGNTDLTVKLLASSALNTVPATLERVTIGGTPLTSYKYEVIVDTDGVTKGVLTIDGEHITGNVVIVAKATAATFKVSYDDPDEHVVWIKDGPEDETATYGEDFEMLFKVDEHYLVTNRLVTILVNNEPLKFTEDWLFRQISDDTIRIKIYGHAIEGDVHVHIESAPRTYTITADTMDIQAVGDDKSAPGCTVKINDTEGPTAEVNVNAGTTLNLTATAGEGYIFLRWESGGEVISTDIELSGVPVKGNATYTAVFVKNDANFTDLVLNYQITGDDTAQVTGPGFFTPSELVIPETVAYEGKTFRVTKIVDDAFYNSAILKTVSIPASIESIGEGAFYNCADLESIKVTGNGNYKDVNGILFTADGKTLIQYPAKMNGSSYAVEGVDEIGYGAFYASSNLESVIMPSVKTIGVDAFRYSNKLSSVTISSTVSIGDNAFGNTNVTVVTLKHTENPASDVVEETMLSWKLPGSSSEYSTLDIDASVAMTLPTIPGSVGKAIRFSSESNVSITGIMFYETPESPAYGPSELAGKSFKYDAVAMKWIGVATYDIIIDGEHVKRTDGNGKATDGMPVYVTIAPFDHYKLPLTITVSVEGITGNLTPGSGYFYKVNDDGSEGTIEIIPGRVVGKITIAVEVTLREYAVSLTGDHVTPAGDNVKVATLGTDVILNFSVATGYINPVVSVMVGSNSAVVGKDYKVEGTTITIFGDSVKGTIVVTVTVEPREYTVSFAVTNAERTDTNAVKHGQPAVIELTAYNHWLPPSNLTVRVSGFSVDFEYSVNGNIATITIPGNEVSGNIDIIGAAVQVLYKVDVDIEPDESGTVSGTGSYVFESNVTLEATANEGYEFINWTLGNEVFEGAVLMIVVEGNVTYVANFKKTVTDVLITEEIDSEKMEELFELMEDTDGINLIMNESDLYKIPNEMLFDDRILGKTFSVTVMNGDNLVSLWMFDTSKDAIEDPVNTQLVDMGINQGIFDETSSEVIDIVVGNHIKNEGLINEAIYLKLSASGVMPFAATVKYKVSGAEDYLGHEFSLYFYNISGSTAALVDEGMVMTVDSEGFVEFTITHASTYVLMTTEKAPIPPPPEDLTMIYILVIAVALVMVVLMVIVARMPEKE